MICQKTANYKEERIVMKKLIYIIFIISYTISLLDFIILSHVWFWIWFWFQYYIFVFYIICYLHVCCHHNCFVQDCIHHLCSVHIHHSVIYSSMQLSFILNIIFLIHCITFNILYLIIIFDICCHYSWDLSLYLYSAYHLIFSIVFALIHMWHFLYIDNWLSFSWSDHINRAYSKVLNTI